MVNSINSRVQERKIKYQKAENKTVEVNKKEEGTENNQNSQSVSDVLKSLQKEFQGAHIQIRDLTGRKEIEQYAISHYGSFEIVISDKALKKMMENKDFLEQCKTAIKEARKEQGSKINQLVRSGKKVMGCGIVLDEDGNVSQWTASKDTKPKQSTTDLMFQNMDSQLTKIRTKDGGVIVIKKQISYQASKDLAKLARCRNQQSVKSTISGIQGQIYRLKTSKGDKKQIAALVRQADQVVLKAKLKVKLLKKEEIMEHAAKVQKAKGALQRAMQTRRMLNEKRTMRKSREYGQIRDYYPTPKEQEEERRLNQMEHKAEQYMANVSQGAVNPLASAGIGEYGGGITGGSGVDLSGMTIDISV